MKYKNTIFGTLKHFLKFNLETNANKEWISSRYENVKIFENLMQSFNSESENETLLNLYKQLCDAYMIYLIMEKFKIAKMILLLSMPIIIQLYHFNYLI